MRKPLPAAVLVFLVFAALPALACGEKLVGLSHGARYMNLAHPGVILLFAPSGSSAANLADDEQFQTAIKKDRHILESGRFDVVLTDAKNAAEIDQRLQTHSSRAVVVPIIEGLTKAEIKALERQYPALVAAHSKAGKYRAAIDDAMEARMQNGEPMTMARK